MIEFGMAHIRMHTTYHYHFICGNVRFFSFSRRRLLGREKPTREIQSRTKQHDQVIPKRIENKVKVATGSCRKLYDAYGADGVRQQPRPTPTKNVEIFQRDANDKNPPF